MQPFDIGIWILTFVTIISLSLTLVGFYKIHPLFKKSLKKLHIDDDDDSFTFGTSMFMTFGFLCQQGTIRDTFFVK